MATRKSRGTRDGLEVLHRRYIAGRPDQEVALEAARLGSRIAQEIHDLRTAAGLTQRQLAAKVGTSHSVISRLEAADYEGHSLRLLHRICAALDRRLEVRFLPAGPRRRKIA
jgi:ribosome-binding protein aMBF1 (putative translation factor)